MTIHLAIPHFVSWAQWLVIVWLMFGLSSWFFRENTLTVKIANTAATVVWALLLYWGGFWS